MIQKITVDLSRLPNYAERLIKESQQGDSSAIYSLGLLLLDTKGCTLAGKLFLYLSGKMGNVLAQQKILRMELSQNEIDFFEEQIRNKGKTGDIAIEWKGSVSPTNYVHPENLYASSISKIANFLSKIFQRKNS